MIKTELYFDFKYIFRKDYSAQIKFYEKYIDILENQNSFKLLNTRREFMRRIFILHSCAIAYSKSKKYDKTIEIFDTIISHIISKEKEFNIDLNREHYYIDSLFEKGKALSYKKKFREARKTFKTILETGYANYIHSEWYVSIKHRWLIDNLDSIIILFAIIVMMVPKYLFNLEPNMNFIFIIIGILLLFFGWIIRPSQKTAKIMSRSQAKKFNSHVESREDSIKYHTRKIEQAPNNAIALVERGIAYNLNNDFEKSLADLTKAYNIDPDNAEALYYRAICFEKLEKYKECIQDLSILLEMKEYGQDELLNNRGRSYMQLNNYEAALNDYNKAIKLEPHFAIYRFDRAFLYQENGKNKEAIEDYNVVLKLDPQDCVAMTNRGEAYYAIGDKEKAKADFEKAKESDYQEAIDNLANFDF